MRTSKTGLSMLVLLALMLCTSMVHMAGYADTPDDQNGALILGEASERYIIYGINGIRVSGGHRGMWSSNMKRSPIEIDGGALSAQRFSPVNESADFNASPHGAYFVQQTAICNLPPAAASPGDEIVVANAGGN